jgi:protein-disulfide isomerase
MKRLLPFLLILIVLGGAVGATAWYMKRSAPPAATAVAGVPVAPVPVGPTEPGAQPPHAEGPADAPATLEEFGDFQCPPCGVVHPVLKQMEKEFGPKLRIIFREFPLVPTHAHALAAARAAEAAGLQGKFWPMHDIIYENQKEWKDVFDVRPVFEGYATKVGLDLDGFRGDLSSSKVQDRITEDGKRGRSLNVKGTPTVFLNGREVPFESLAPEKLRVLIQKEVGGK